MLEFSARFGRGLRWQKFKVRNLKPVVYHLALHFGLPDGLAETVFGVGIAVVI